MDGFLLPTAVDSDHPEQTGPVTAAMVPDALQSYAAPRAEGSVDSLASTAASFATHPAAEQLVIVVANNPMDTGGVGAVSATSVEPAQCQLIANGLPGADAQPNPHTTTAVAVEPGNVPVTFWQGSGSSSCTGDMVSIASGAAELGIAIDTAHNTAAVAQIEEGQAVDGEEYVSNLPAIAGVDTLAASSGDVSDVEVSPAASGLDQPAAPEDLNATLGAELAGIFALLAAEEADTPTGLTSTSVEAIQAVHRTDVVAKDGRVLAVIVEDNAQSVASSLAASDPGLAAELAGSPLETDSSEVHTEQTAQAAAIDEGGLRLVTVDVIQATDDAAAETQTSSFPSAETAQVLSQRFAAVALTAEAEVQPTAAEFSRLELAPSAAADFQDSFQAQERVSDADLPAVMVQHDAVAAAAAWGVQSASAASTNSPAGDIIKLHGDDAARAFCSAELITLGEIFDPMVLLGSAELALKGKLCTV